jgi:hypothetical protein
MADYLDIPYAFTRNLMSCSGGGRARPPNAASVQDDLMTLLDQEPGRRQTKAVP